MRFLAGLFCCCCLSIATEAGGWRMGMGGVVMAPADGSTVIALSGTALSGRGIAVGIGDILAPDCPDRLRDHAGVEAIAGRDYWGYRF